MISAINQIKQNILNIYILNMFYETCFSFKNFALSNNPPQLMLQSIGMRINGKYMLRYLINAPAAGVM